jgi:hypothetical protein
MLVPFKVAGTVAAAALASSLVIHTGRNVLQTMQAASTAPQIASGSSTAIPSTVRELRALSRQEILHLYVHHCPEPTSLSVLEGDWHGMLLHNNGLVRLVWLGD